MGFLPKLYPLVFVLLSFLAFPFSLSSSSLATQLCSHEQATALLQFKNSFSIDESASFFCESTYPKTESWKGGTDCCSWNGITCDNVTGDVLDLDLSCSNLSGTFPSNSSLFLLKNLQSLNLSNNYFKLSKIPSLIGQFVSLKHLDLSMSAFTGQIPDEIAHLSKLVSLDISNLEIEGSGGGSVTQVPLKLEITTFKSIVQNLTKVRELSLAEVSMPSVDARYISNLSSSMVQLNLWGSSLIGIFPENVFRFPNLEFLVLTGSDQLTVSLPSSNWTSPLEFLDLEGMLSLGGLPDSIGGLESLKFLFLRCNFQGPIPASIGNLSQLRFLELSFNNFSGLIPPSLTNLTQLTHFKVYFNQLSGPIPLHANSLLKLKVLGLGFNLLNGTIPSWIFTLPSLEVLDLYFNQLQGSIPSSISNLVNLTELDLSSNNLSGSLDLDMFSQLQKLQTLSLSNNSLSLTDNINVNYTLPYLQDVYLSSCNLSEFPNFLRDSTDLRDLDLSENRIEGHIPEWMWDLGKDTLDRLILSHNFLIALELIPWRQISTLDLRSNKLQGVLPILPNQIAYFSISNNYLSGEISFQLCKANSLEILDLSHNNLRGMIPECLLNLSKSLSVLNLQANNFYGHVPSLFPKGCRFNYLNIHGNRIEGPLPRSLVNCTELETLDISNNNIEDTFPYWLESLPELQVLVLRSNKFHGSVHNTKSNPSFPKLRVLDLSNNDFAGLLPVHYIENLKAMVDPHEDDDNLPHYMGERNFLYQFSLVLIIKGFTIEMEKVLTIFTSLDLSENKFVGEIPTNIGKLYSLKGLNLSNNNLDGHIPHTLGKLTNLEWLDLSSNELVGEIPQELLSLKYLSILNLSSNQLVGCIPQGNQFNTFENSSYEGNTGLYGFPLTKSCDGNGTSQYPPGSFHGKDHELWEFGWRVVLLGYGCGLVFGLLMGFLAFQIGKPKWFVTLFDG